MVTQSMAKETIRPTAEETQATAGTTTTHPIHSHTAEVEHPMSLEQSGIPRMTLYSAMKPHRPGVLHLQSSTVALPEADMLRPASEVQDVPRKELLTQQAGAVWSPPHGMIAALRLVTGGAHTKMTNLPSSLKVHWVPQMTLFPT